jgi:hypothetical protein
MNEHTQKNRSIHAGSMVGVIWYIGWWFTLGITDLSFWQGVLSLIIWPYYLGYQLSVFLL